MKQSSDTLTSLSSVNKAFVEPFPNSTKVYATGSRDDILVPMRRIELTDTIGDLAEKNDPIHVYDTSGPTQILIKQLATEKELIRFEVTG
jgi:phosphomethylpyrimidine synthase